MYNIKSPWHTYELCSDALHGRLCVNLHIPTDRRHTCAPAIHDTPLCSCVSTVVADHTYVYT